jgi:protein-disulfide isomerase
VNVVKREIRLALPALLAAACLMTAPSPGWTQSQSDAALKTEVESLKGEVKSLRSELDEVKKTLHDLTTRPEPVFDATGSQAMGNANAKLVMIEFSDYQCPYCMDYFTNSYRKIIDEYVKTGKLRYVVRDFPGESIHPYALKAAEGARCAAEQGKFWEMHDGLFNNQRNLGTTGISDSAQSSGLNLTQFQACLDSGKHTAGIKKDEDDTVKLGVKGTPAFFIGTPDPANPLKIKLAKIMIGSQPLTAFQQVIDGLLAK